VIDGFAGLRWGIRASFIEYVRELPDGTIAWSDGEGLFPLQSIDDRILMFSGRFRARGHGDLLRVEIHSPRIDLDRGVLSVLDERNRALPLVGLTHPEVVATASTWSLTVAAPTLTSDGASLFGGSYRPGEHLDSLTVEMPIPGEWRRP
jgi:hypothetical protein